MLTVSRRRSMILFSDLHFLMLLPQIAPSQLFSTVLLGCQRGNSLKPRLSPKFFFFFHYTPLQPTSKFQPFDCKFVTHLIRLRLYHDGLKVQILLCSQLHHALAVARPTLTRLREPTSVTFITPSHHITFLALPLLHVGMSLHQVFMGLSPRHELFDCLGTYSIQLHLMTPDDTFADCFRCNIIES